jgi:putative nucleotidyltransferase with HDIG domain
MLASPRDLLGPRLKIPSLPLVCSRLTETIEDPRSSTVQIAELISHDPALTARLLKLVNSSFYGFPNRIETPSQAVMIIGTAHLCDLALTTAITRIFRHIPPDLVSMESFWRHSIACGLAARLLAAQRREPDGERFFVAGVLHDIGRLVLYLEVPDAAREALTRSRERDELLHVSEREVIGFDHAAVGAALLRAWRLPASLEEAVAHHHRPPGAQRYPVEAALVHAADIIAQSTGLGTSGEVFVPPLDAGAWEALDLGPTAISTVVEELTAQFDGVVRAMLVDGS